MRYRAERDGLLPNGSYIREGEEFEFDGVAPSWATPLDEPEQMEDVSVPEKKPARKPKTK